MSRTITFDAYAIALGLSFVPVDRQSKKAYHLDWTNPETVFTADRFKPDDNHGARWGIASGDMVDLDCDSPEASRICEQRITKGPRYGRPSNRHSHYLVRVPGAKTKPFVNPITKETIIEIRSTGSQSVLPPSIHSPSGEVYAWERQDEPPSIDPATLLRDVGQIAAAALIASLWETRHRFALALAGFFAKHRMPQERAIEIINLVILAAKDEEPNDRLRAVRDTYSDWENGEEISGNLAEILGDNADVVVKTLAEWLQLERERFHIYNEAALVNRVAAKFLVRGVLVQGSLVALVSPPDVGKTFLALDLVLSVAAAQEDWLGKSLLRSGPVLYVIGEGAGRFKLRYLAWKQAHSVEHALPFHWLDQAVPLVDDKAMRGFIKQVAPIRPAAIVFDTLSRCFAGHDENSAQDMGLAINACDELRSRTGALILLVHHTRKDGMVERGSSALRAGVDTILTLVEDTEERGLLTLTCERQKDAEPFPPFQIQRTVFPVDGVFDEEGKPETTCVIHLPTAEAAAAGPDKRRAKILQLVRAQPGISRTKVVTDVGGRRKDVLSVLDDLIKQHVLRVETKGNVGRLFVVESARLGLTL